MTLGYLCNATHARARGHAPHPAPLTYPAPTAPNWRRHPRVETDTIIRLEVDAMMDTVREWRAVSRDQARREKGYSVQLTSPKKDWSCTTHTEHPPPRPAPPPPTPPPRPCTTACARCSSYRIIVNNALQRVLRPVERLSSTGCLWPKAEDFIILMAFFLAAHWQSSVHSPNTRQCHWHSLQCALQHAMHHQWQHHHMITMVVAFCAAPRG